MIVNVMPASSRLGQYVINELLKLGVTADQIVASVRNIEKAQFLADKGISIRLADYDKKESLQMAFKGTDVLLLIPTFAHVEERIIQHFNAIEAAKSAKIKRVIFAGFMTASLESKFEIAPFMLYAESKLRVSGLDWTIVRNGRYLEEVSLSVPDMVQTGIWERPIKNAGVAYISREALARAIAVVCIGNQHSRKTYELTGIKAYKMPELTELISKITASP